MIRRALLALCLLATPAFAQTPPPVPALPDSIRLTTYTISATTCACAVGFQIYGDNTDVDNWIQVFVNGVQKLSTDPTFGWSLTSPTGSLSVIPRPITDAVLTFNSVQTATIVILGAERPRRLVEFSESQGVTARSLNQVFNTLFAELREAWDNKFIFSGVTFATLPPAVAGRRAFITDGVASGCADGTCTTFGTNVTAGGGTLPLLIWYNGTHWTLIGK
jgi:hypothetical protein